MRTGMLGRGVAWSVVLLVVAATIWLPLVHLLFRSDPSGFHGTRGVPPRAEKLARRHLRLWQDERLRAIELQRMRAGNAEWDFMGRTFLVLALANMALRDANLADEHLAVIDRILDETLRLEAEHGQTYFLMPYVRCRPFVQAPARSLMVDGEIALILGARRLVADDPRWRTIMQQRAERILARMEASPLLCCESYPNEGWLFCNSIAAASIRIHDRLDGTDHDAFLRRWLERVRGNLVDPRTGLLVSSFTYDGQHLDGPEGSSIWMVAHCLQLIDPEFAADQYARAKRELIVSILGFSYAREWPGSWTGPDDIDSGPVIPVLGVSAGSSGMAFIAAAAFDDPPLLTKLFTTLDFAAFPIEENGALRYAASNQNGDAVLLYSTVLGPLWDRVQSPAEDERP